MAMETSHSPEQILPQAFPGIGPQETQDLLAAGQVRSYPAGAVLCRENALEDTFYILLDGAVDVSKTINNLERRMLTTLEAGSFFGEMALIHNAPRGATVTAKTPVTVMEINQEKFNATLKNSGSMSLAMVHQISTRLRENDEMAVEDLRLRAGELARAYQRLAEQDVARREFLTNIAHELRTPLMTAGGYIQLIQSGAVAASEINHVLETVARSIQQITLLVNDILFLQEMDLILPKFQAVNIVDIAHIVAAKYAEKALAAKIELSITAEENLPSVSGDAKSLERALTALLDNAIKFSPNGGQVSLSISRDKSQVVIKVRDEGIGIAAEDLPRIFDRFRHLERHEDRLFGGIGLGLAITRQVIQQHNGHLDVESKPGKGTTFIVRLNTVRVVM